jgi:subtilase family serine protease
MQTNRRAMVGVLAGALLFATLVALPADAVGASSSGNHGTNGETDVNVCPSAVPAGQATCLARRRTDSAATSQRPTRPGALRSSAAIGNSGAYDPLYLQSAYVTPSAYNGTGQTVAIVDAYNDPSAETDLGNYRSFFGLSACTTANNCFRKVDESGGTTYPSGNTGWSQEISLDLDMVSALCPNCHILLVEASSASISDLGTAVNEAVARGANVVSNSYGGQEYSSENSDSLAYFNHPGVAVTVAAGDGGYGPEFPAASNAVTAVGGTSLQQATNTGTRSATETVWSGTGSGCSTYEPKSVWQTDTAPGDCAYRTIADVSAVADPSTGVWVYDTYGGGSWAVFGGTSVATPIVGAVYALAGNAPGSKTPMNSLPYAHPAALNDVTSGSNGSCSTAYLCNGKQGYDGPTGLGTPNGIAAFTPTAATVLPAPTNLVASGANTTVNLSWSAPSSNGGPSVTGYNVYEGTTASGESTTPVNGTPIGATSYTVTGLTNGTTYYFDVTAVNSVGNSVASKEASATPTAATVPPAPTNLVASGANTTVNLSWSAPSSNGGPSVTGYNVYKGTTASGESTTPVNGTPIGATSYTVTGLTNGTTYYFDVTAVNSVGNSVASKEASTTPATTPGAPSLTARQATSKGVTLTWSAPASNGGAAITGYKLNRSTRSGRETSYATVSCTTSTCSYTDTGTNSRTTYYYNVAATNRVGTGPVSNQASAMAK